MLGDITLFDTLDNRFQEKAPKPNKMRFSYM